jgi:hypothetical protein
LKYPDDPYWTVSEGGTVNTFLSWEIPETWRIKAFYSTLSTKGKKEKKDSLALGASQQKHRTAEQIQGDIYVALSAAASDPTSPLFNTNPEAIMERIRDHSIGDPSYPNTFKITQVFISNAFADVVTFKAKHKQAIQHIVHAVPKYVAEGRDGDGMDVDAAGNGEVNGHEEEPLDEMVGFYEADEVIVPQGEDED